AAGGAGAGTAGEPTRRAKDERGAAEDAGEGQLGEGAMRPGKSDQHVAGGGNDGVAGGAEAGRDGDPEPAVAAGALVARWDADHRAAALGGAARDRRHHAAEA